MQRYGGELIYHGRDSEGVIEIVDAYGTRALHFGTPPKQSAMSLQQPERPELAYVRAMLSPLLFTEDPKSVLVVGLGGGTLARFLLKAFPSCRVEAVEHRAAVVEIAHAYFDLPRDDRLLVHIADAYAHVESRAMQTGGLFDLILVDAYDNSGMDQTINTDEFVGNCRQLLDPRGVLAMNLWGTHQVSLRLSLGLLKTFFPGKALKLQVPNRGNIIGLGLGDELDFFSKHKPIEPRALALESRTGLEMPYFLRNLRHIS